MELTPAELWSRIQETVRSSVPEQGFRTWLAGPTAVGLSAGELIIEAPSPFHRDWIEDKYAPLLEATGQRILNRPLTVTITCAPDPVPIPVPSLDLGGAS